MNTKKILKESLLETETLPENEPYVDYEEEHEDGDLHNIQHYNDMHDRVMDAIEDLSDKFYNVVDSDVQKLEEKAEVAFNRLLSEVAESNEIDREEMIDIAADLGFDKPDINDIDVSGLLLYKLIEEKHRVQYMRRRRR